MSEVTAAELLAKQREVETLRERQSRAWSATQDADEAVRAAQDAYSEARWRVEEAERELAELETLVVSDGPQ